MNTDERLADMERRIEQLEKAHSKLPDPGEGYELCERDEAEDYSVANKGQGDWSVWFAMPHLNERRYDYTYRRKIKQPKFTGPTCEMTPELEARFRASCERIVEQGGNCHEVECDDCVGGAAHNTRVTCLRNRFRSNLAGHMCEVAKANAQRWLDTHPAPPKFTTRAEYIASGGDPVVFDEVAISSGKLEIFACFNWTEARLINEIVPDKFYRLPADLLENPEPEILRMPGFNGHATHYATDQLSYVFQRGDNALHWMVTGPCYETRIQAIAHWNKQARAMGAEYGRRGNE